MAEVLQYIKGVPAVRGESAKYIVYPSPISTPTHEYVLGSKTFTDGARAVEWMAKHPTWTLRFKPATPDIPREAPLVNVQLTEGEFHLLLNNPESDLLRAKLFDLRSALKAQYLNIQEKA